MSIEELKERIVSLQDELNQLVKLHKGELSEENIIKLSTDLDVLIAEYLEIFCRRP